MRLALEAGMRAVEMSGLDPTSLGIVFASSNGDAPVVNDILEAVTGDGRPVSPTQFHNSVHNAAAGYWSIATGSRHAVTCLGCHDDTVAAALLKAVAEARVEDRPVLLCIYDVPIPGPLAAKRPTTSSFGAGFVLTPRAAPGSMARIRLAYGAAPSDRSSWLPRCDTLRPLAEGNAAARCLRLLEAVALGQCDAFALPYLDAHLDISVTPCSAAN